MCGLHTPQLLRPPFRTGPETDGERKIKYLTERLRQHSDAVQNPRLASLQIHTLTAAERSHTREGTDGAPLRDTLSFRAD